MTKPLSTIISDAPLLEVHVVLSVIAESSDEGMYPGEGFTVESIWLDKDRADAAAAGLGTFGTEFPDDMYDDEDHSDVAMGHVETVKISR